MICKASGSSEGHSESSSKSDSDGGDCERRIVFSGGADAGFFTSAAAFGFGSADADFFSLAGGTGPGIFGLLAALLKPAAPAGPRCTLS